MDCPECGCKMSAAKVSRAYAGGKIVIGDVRASKCVSCGFEVISGREYERVRGIVNGVKVGIPAGIMASAKLLVF